MEIRQNLLSFLSTIPKSVKLVAVSKTKPVEAINEAYEAGQLIFGENKVQDLVDKVTRLPDDIEWHFIGHMQTNKVKFIAPFVKLIHAVDSLKLLKEINKHALKNDRIIDCLIQFHIADETTKFGFSIQEITDMLKDPDFINLKNIRVTGVMGMATYTDDNEQISIEFRKLTSYFKILKSNYFSELNYFKEISMGMSGDYKIAIEEGSTMIRIGTSIFGSRNY
jgi:PLP dependent protein